MDIVNKMCECVKNLDTEGFLDLINQVPSDKVSSIDFSLVDSALDKSKDFDLCAKLAYSYTFKRPMYTKLCSEIVKKPYLVSKNALYFVACKEEKLRKRLLDVLCFRVTTTEEAVLFMRQVEADGFYMWYHNSIVEGKDTALKIHYVLYISYLTLNNMFDSPLDLAKAIVRCRTMNNMYSSKAEALLKLTCFTKDKDTLMYIKNHLKEVVLADRRRLSGVNEGYKYIMGKEETAEERQIRENKDQQVLSYYKSQFEQNTGIKMG